MPKKTLVFIAVGPCSHEAPASCVNNLHSGIYFVPIRVRSFGHTETGGAALMRGWREVVGFEKDVGSGRVFTSDPGRKKTPRQPLHLTPPRFQRDRMGRIETQLQPLECAW